MADENPLQAIALGRLAAARQQKSYREQEIKECYFFAAPHRQRTVNSLSAPPQAPPLDAGDLNTDEAFILCGDFETEVVNTYMPESLPWCERGPGMDLPGGEAGPIWKQIKDKVAEGDAKIFQAMKASNLYPEVSKSFNPDLAIGTVALWIERPHSASAITAMAVPFRELEINLGPYGEVDDRFAVRWTRHTYVEVLLGKEIWAKVPAELKKTIKDKPA